LQNTVETATYGSEFCVARQAIDKILWNADFALF